jgi:hypothetical protein
LLGATRLRTESAQPQAQQTPALAAAYWQPAVAADVIFRARARAQCNAILTSVHSFAKTSCFPYQKVTKEVQKETVEGLPLRRRRQVEPTQLSLLFGSS